MNDNTLLKSIGVLLDEVLDKRFEDFGQMLDGNLDKKIQTLEERVDNRFDQVEGRLNGIENRLGKVELLIDQAESCLQRIELTVELDIKYSMKKLADGYEPLYRKINRFDEEKYAEINERIRVLAASMKKHSTDIDQLKSL